MSDSPPPIPKRRRSLHLFLEGDTPAPGRLLETLHSTGLHPVTASDSADVPDTEQLLFAFDGRLQPAHAALLRRATPALLLASDPAVARPTTAELGVLRALLSNRSLIEGIPWQVTARVSQMAQVLELSKRVGSLAGTPSKAAEDVTYELLVNAMLDAPVDDTGALRYAHRRSEVRDVAIEDACELRATFSGSTLCVMVRDRFGGLTTEPVARTVESLGGKARVNADGGGAGLGMRRILEQTDTLAFRVVPGRLTEVFCTVELGGGRRRGQPKSLFFLRE